MFKDRTNNQNDAINKNAQNVDCNDFKQILRKVSNNNLATSPPIAANCAKLYSKLVDCDKQSQLQQVASNGSAKRTPNYEPKPKNSDGTNKEISTTSAAALAKPWVVTASCGAVNTTNPIRELIETMNLSENPNKKVIPLSIGDPTIFGNLKPCAQIVDALNNAVRSGKFYGYQTASGMESARDAVASYHNKLTGNNVKRRDVILTSGCSHAIDLSICVLARRGQNILIPRPGFPLYKTLTSVYGINFKQYNLIASDDWKIDLQHLESLIDDNTAAIIVNNPSNPCGSVYSKQHLLDIISVAERHRKPIIADEIYDKFVFNQLPSPSGTPTSQASSNSSPNRNSECEPQGKPASETNCIGRATLPAPQQQAKLARQSSGGQKDEAPQHSNGIAKHSNGFVLVKKVPKHYTDPSLVKCPNRRYRYNGDDGPERNHALDSDSIGDDSSSLGASQKFDDEEDSAEYFDETDVEESCEDALEISQQQQHLQQQQQQQQQLEQQQQQQLQASTLTSSLQELAGEVAPFIAMSSLTKTVPILTCSGISKTCLIPGLRLGWIIMNDLQGVFDASVRDGLGRLTQRLMGPSSLVQGALADILSSVPDSFYARTMHFIHKNARICYTLLSQVPGLNPHMPQGTMYLMVGFDARAFPRINGDLDFTSKLMNEQSVLVLPGMCFDFPNYFRICLTVPSAIIEEAMARIREFCNKYHDKLATTDLTLL